MACTPLFGFYRGHCDATRHRSRTAENVPVRSAVRPILLRPAIGTFSRGPRSKVASARGPRVAGEELRRLEVVSKRRGHRCIATRRNRPSSSTGVASSLTRRNYGDGAGEDLDSFKAALRRTEGQSREAEAP